MSCGCGGSSNGGGGGTLESGGYPGSVLDTLTDGSTSTTLINNNSQGLAGLTQELCTRRAQCWVMIIAVILLLLLFLRK